MTRRRDLLRQGVAACLATPLIGRTQAPAAAAYDWRSLPFGGGGFVDGFVFHPRERGLLYARTDIGGLYRHDPSAGRWLPLLDHLGRADADLMGVLSIAVDPADPDRLYAACGLYTGRWSRTGALLASHDRGARWQVHELGIGLGGNEPGRGSGERLQVDPWRGERLWLGSTRDGLHRSDDHGRRFSRVAGCPGQQPTLVLLDPTSGGAGQPCRRLWVGCHDQPGLWVSSDGGDHFEREPVAPGQVPQRAVLGPQGTLYVSFARPRGATLANPGELDGGSVWKRDSAGRWSEISPRPAGRFGWSGLDVDRQRPGRLVVATIERWAEGDELFVSDDDGVHWQPLGPRSRHDDSRHPWLADYRRHGDRLGHWIADLKIDPFQGDRAVYGTGYGLWMTDQLRAPRIDWRFEVDGLEETAVLGLRSPSGGATLLAAMGDVGGGAWEDTARAPSAGLFQPCRETNRAVDAAWQTPAIVVRTADQAATGGYWSADGGASWRPFPTAPFAPQGGQRPLAGELAVSARGGFWLCALAGRGAVTSADRGRRWAPCEGWPARGAPVAERSVEGVFYAFDPDRGQVLGSTDGGARFTPIITGLPVLADWQSAQLHCSPAAPRALWLALPDGLWFLGGEGRPRPLPTVQAAWCITTGAPAPGRREPALFLWGQLRGDGAEGLFRSDDEGRSWLRIDDPQHRYGRLLSIEGDPLQHGTVYLAPHGRGVVMGRPRTGGAG
ncbi:WD40/YVTN/BNR-like repeat-containing protein [Ideonella alba]|uniref:Uncharacterized protein n=1 Tax=Ideonella alba TaxID=2824118 RepID=A0A941BJB5_9BURK|nr:hypothetical protein [Ideonella alba]MBQ0928909.1 hypothetical protein [Ideonella alba]